MLHACVSDCGCQRWHVPATLLEKFAHFFQILMNSQLGNACLTLAAVLQTCILRSIINTKTATSALFLVLPLTNSLLFDHFSYPFVLPYFSNTSGGQGSPLQGLLHICIIIECDRPCDKQVFLKRCSSCLPSCLVDLSLLVCTA